MCAQAADPAHPCRLGRLAHFLFCFDLGQFDFLVDQGAELRGHRRTARPATGPPPTGALGPRSTGVLGSGGNLDAITSLPGCPARTRRRDQRSRLWPRQSALAGLGDRWQRRGPLGGQRRWFIGLRFIGGVCRSAGGGLGASDQSPARNPAAATPNKNSPGRRRAKCAASLARPSNPPSSRRLA